jgi:type I restriction enzyme R subunit
LTNFKFLKSEWPEIWEAAARAEAAMQRDPRAACFYSRRALELAVNWAYRADTSLRMPYEDKLSALIHEPTFKAAAGEDVFRKAKVINTLGNHAVHRAGPIQAADAVVSVRELFHVTYWFARTYARGDRPASNIQFDPVVHAAPSSVAKQSIEQIQRLESELRKQDELLTGAVAEKEGLAEQIALLQAEVAAAKQAASAQPDAHDYSEAETRDYFIDLMLKEAGWRLDESRDREYAVSGMATPDGKGFVDYVLWGEDGKPLALVEAKRTKKSAQIGQQQAKLYADALEWEFGRRPVILYSNGYDHWMWDDAYYPSRAVQGFLKKAELELIIQRRTTRRRLADAPINGKIVERYYQTRAIRRIGEAFERDRDRKALLVMATGAGKTRTVIALADLLMKANWAKRVLFLADRVALVNQAVGAFKTHLPEAAPVNLVTEKGTEGRVYVSTYPTIMSLIDETNEGERRFGPGHFDLIVIDEAHRSVYQKYGAIFEYFDSLLVGLTATPKDEVDFDTYGLFDLERGVPTDSYGLEDAVKDGFLVPAQAVSVPLKFPREGITYDQLSEEEKDQWDALEWSEDGTAPDRIEAEAVNKWLFNKDTVDKALAHLMERGQKVAGGDRLGKTIVFAKNQAHAEFIAQRFDINYPHFQGAFARVIHSGMPYAQSLIDDFSNPDKAPHIAISVDMLDTGIDIPEVVNLVFLKLVRSKTKFWQMVGRGTRLSPDLFGPGEDKEFFYILDYCMNLEFFNQDPITTDGAIGVSLSKRLFTTRVELIAELDEREPSGTKGHSIAEPGVAYGDPTTDSDLRRDVARQLHGEVAAMNTDNFIVRPHRRMVEEYARPEAWTALTAAASADLAAELSGLPSEQDPEAEEAKRFDLLLLNLQLARLLGEPAFQRLRDQVKAIAGLLEEKSAIPMVRDQMVLIQDIQTDEWWLDVTLPMLESVRRKLRSLVRLIEKQNRRFIFTDFADQMGVETTIQLPGFIAGESFEKFRAKVQEFLREHQDDIAISKLRSNVALTAEDLAALERLLAESGVGGTDQIDRAKERSQGLGLFIRSLVGLDREAAKIALAAFLGDKNLTANQIEFVNLIVDHLTAHGAMEPALLYESPFTDIAPRGPDGIFSASQVDDLIAVLHHVSATAGPVYAG